MRLGERGVGKRCWCGHVENRHRKGEPHCADCPGWIWMHPFSAHAVTLDAFCREKIIDAFNRHRGLPTADESRTLETKDHGTR